MILSPSPLSSVTCFLQLYPSTKVSTSPSECHPDWILSSQLLSRASLLHTFSVDAEVIFPDYLILDIYWTLGVLLAHLLSPASSFIPKGGWDPWYA